MSNHHLPPETQFLINEARAIAERLKEDIKSISEDTQVDELAVYKRFCRIENSISALERGEYEDDDAKNRLRDSLSPQMVKCRMYLPNNDEPKEFIRDIDSAKIMQDRLLEEGIWGWLEIEPIEIEAGDLPANVIPMSR